MTQDPPRLTIVGATELERRLLGAVAAERPSPEIARRMELGLGFSSPSAPVVPAAAARSATTTATTTATTAATTKAVWAWASAGVLAVAVTAGAVGAWTWSRSPVRSPRPSDVGAPALSAPVVATPRPVTPSHGHAGPARNATDLHAEIALIDAVRTAIKTRQPSRALALLRRYDVTYSLGTLRPEAAALGIEALVLGGQTDRARALAREFLAKHPDSPLRERVERIARDAPR